MNYQDEAVRRAIEKLDSGAQWLHKSAEQELRGIGKPALPVLLDALDNVKWGDAGGKLVALGLLGEMLESTADAKDVQAQRAIGFLLESLAAGPLINEPQEARRVIAKIGRIAVPRLIDLLQKHLEYIEPRAEWGKMGTKGENIQPGWKNAAVEIIRALGEIREPSSVPILSRALEGGIDFLMREAAVALRGMGKEAVDALIAALSNPDIMVRSRALSALSYHREEGVFAAMVDVMLHDDDNLAMRAARIIVNSAWENEAREIAFAAMQENPQLRERCQKAIAEMNADEKKRGRAGGNAKGPDIDFGGLDLQSAMRQMRRRPAPVQSAETSKLARLPKQALTGAAI